MKRTFQFIIGFILLLFSSRSIHATDIPWGVHLLNPQELSLVLPYRGETERFFVTIPLKLSERDTKTWNEFFELALKANITPIVRWVTEFDGNAWTVPTRKEIVESSRFLSSLNWSGKRYLVLFNEPNHAAEWGGRIDPEEYVDIAHFAAMWLKTESLEYVVLPAGLDAAAPNGAATMDSFTYIDRMHRHNNDFFQIIDGWTSHAYPNPGFASSPYKRDKNSLMGFSWEYQRLKQLTGREYEIYITETGWKTNYRLNRLLPNYYSYTVSKIWNNTNIKAITLFVFRGFNGPFADFSMLDVESNPTPQFKAFLKAVEK